MICYEKLRACWEAPRPNIVWKTSSIVVLLDPFPRARLGTAVGMVWLPHYEEQWILQEVIKNGASTGTPRTAVEMYHFFSSLWLEQDCEYRGSAVGSHVFMKDEGQRNEMMQRELLWQTCVLEDYISLVCSKLGVVNSI